MANYHSILWIDHHKAVVWNFTDDTQTKSVVKAHDQHEHTHIRKVLTEATKYPMTSIFLMTLRKCSLAFRKFLLSDRRRRRRSSLHSYVKSTPRSALW